MVRRGELKFAFFLASMQTVSGIGVISLLIYLLFAHPFIKYLANAYTDDFAIWILLGIGAPMLVIGVFGCFVTVKTKRAMLITYSLLSSALMCVIAGLEMYTMCGYSERFERGSYGISDYAVRTLYGQDDWITPLVDHVQSSKQCCGPITYESWGYSNFNEYEDVYPYFRVKYKIPETCCREPGSVDCVDVGMKPWLSREELDDIIYLDGCLDVVKNFMRPYVPVMNYVGFVLMFLNAWCGHFVMRLPEANIPEKVLRACE